MVHVWRKIGLLCWKNMKVLQAHWIMTLFEVFVVPISMFAFLTWINSFSNEHTEDKIIKNATYFPRLSQENIESLNMELYYTPYNTFTADLMREVQHTLNFNDISHFPNEQMMKDFVFENITYPRETVVCVVFNNLEDGSAPMNLDYKIRFLDPDWSTDELYVPGPTNTSDRFIKSGFLALQYAIDISYTNMIKPKSTNLTLEYTIQQFPYPPGTVMSSGSVVTGSNVSFFSMITLTVLFLNVFGRIAEDKRTGATELMKLMGLSRWMLWLTWYLRILLEIVVIISIMVFFLKSISYEDIGAIYIKSNWFLIWIFYFLYSVSGATLIFAISTFFSRPNFATCFGIGVWILSYYIPTAIIKPKTKFYYKLLSCLMPNMAMYFGCTAISNFEQNNVGADWSNLNTASTGGTDEIKMSNVLLMFIVDLLIYGLATIYIDAVRPGKYGVPEPFNFFITRSFWGIIPAETSLPAEVQEDQSSKFEPPPQGLAVGIKIQDLRKKYHSGKVAVDGVTLDIYEGQITALLGHNGAGKTTTMSIITGMLPSSGGSVWINNYNIRTDLDKVRDSLGLCPQHNMLLTDLTVLEHLMFFGMLKGLSRHNARQESNILLKSMQLEKKASSMASALSGGMQRKLSLGISLIGGSKVVILDEPTSGLDPQSRREIWDMLLAMRGQRTIVITTHFMEEADVLGDRIAIMDHGRVQCYGTSLYLKKQYGAGYILKLLTQESCNVSNITSVVQASVVTATLKSRLGSELSYSLPSEETPAFPELFNQLEKKKAVLGVSSIGVSVTTLEDVFLNVGKQAAADHVPPVTSIPGPRTPLLNTPGPNNTSAITTNGRSRATGLALLNQQIQALMMKKIIVARRKWWMFLILAVTAVVFTFAAFSLGLNLMKTVDSSASSLRLSLDVYDPSEVWYSEVGQQSSVADRYKDIIKATHSNLRAAPVEQGVSHSLLEEGEKDISKYQHDLIVAAEFNESEGKLNVNAMYNSNSYYSAVISLNLMNNAVLKSYMNSNDYSITTEDHPLRRWEKHNQNIKAGIVALVWYPIISFGLLLLLANFLVFPLLERVSNAKQLQYMSGVSPLTYWSSCFFVDILLYMLVVVVMVAMLPLVDWDGKYGGMKEMAILTLILFLYGLGCIPQTYWFSYFVNTTSSAFSRSVSLNTVIGIICPVLLFIARIFVEETGTLEVLEKLLYLLPQFSLSYILFKFSCQAVKNNKCSSMSESVKKYLCLSEPTNNCCSAAPTTLPYFFETDNDEKESNVIGLPLMMLVFDAFLYFAIILLLDYGVISRVVEAVKRKLWPSQSSQDEVDSDVIMEINRVQSTDTNMLTVNNLMKAYGRNTVAVQGVTFGVMPGECFGLLGVNGAGKTTTFKMLTGAEIPTHGDASIDHFSLHNHKSQYLSQIGYCPQFDALNESLTGREMLELFARLRGIHSADIESVVNKWIAEMGLEEYKEALTESYSGGNKRKLSTAMALIGDPPVIFLDEPTSGVDPVARRNLWSVLAKIQTRNRSIVLTSHSMEECEALCNRLAIMVKGQFVCIGGTQHLKEKFGQGFTVMIKIGDVESQDERCTEVIKAFGETFPACVLKDKHTGLLHYHITDTSIGWCTLFSNMESMKATYEAIDDYTISETTLEQVFLSFAQK